MQRVHSLIQNQCHDLADEPCNSSNVTDLECRVLVLIHSFKRIEGFFICKLTDSLHHWSIELECLKAEMADSQASKRQRISNASIEISSE